MDIPKKSALICAMAMALASCGGGGGGGGNNANGNADDQAGPGGNPPPSGETFLPCVNTETVACSGNSVVDTYRNIAVLDSGVQVYGKSTSDEVYLADPQNNPRLASTAYGLVPDFGGITEMRLEEGTNNTVSRVGMILSNIGLEWDDRTNRPPIVEIFSPIQGRVTLTSNENRPFAFGALPSSHDLTFYDWAVKKGSGTQSNYAGNYYFPRSEPIRCDISSIPAERNCDASFYDYGAYARQQTPKENMGSWSSTSPRELPAPTASNYQDEVRRIRSEANEYQVRRFHEDGDLRAGDDLPKADGSFDWHDKDDGNTGFGVSYPGFKGYRTFENHGYRYANVAGWFTQDTVNIVEWRPDTSLIEHNKVRRGYTAYGSVTPAASIPVAGTARYIGVIYGVYAPNAVARSSADDVDSIRGVAEITVDFAARTARVVMKETATFTVPESPREATFDYTVPLGAIGSNKANYFMGSTEDEVAPVYADNGVVGRFFGPVVNGAPAEIGGTFYLSGNAQGRTVIAGFIARKL